MALEVTHQNRSADLTVLQTSSAPPDRHVEAIKADIRNLLSLCMQGTPDRLPPAEALAEAIALEQLSQEIFALPPREGQLL